MSKSINMLDFNDRESYLQWRAEWREIYKKMSKEIHQGKFTLANQFRSESPNSERTQRNLLSDRYIANQLMFLRTEATEKKNAIIQQHKAEYQLAA